ncbi:MAG: hypothetical protein K2F85_01795 [Helicobacter sp.]|nr:hypothetical protein [Helicobacter sp.]
MSDIESVANQAESNPEAEEQNNQNINPKDMGAVKEDKEQKLRSELRVMRIQQEKDDFGYYKQNAEYINKAYQSIMNFIFNNTCYPPKWVILLTVLAFTYIVGNIDKVDNEYFLIIQSILRTFSEVLATFFLFMLAVPSAKGIRRLFSRFTDKML